MNGQRTGRGPEGPLLVVRSALWREEAAEAERKPAPTTHAGTHGVGVGLRPDSSGGALRWAS